MEDPAYRKLMDYAMRALGQRAHTEDELRKKLKNRPLRSSTGTHEARRSVLANPRRGSVSTQKIKKEKLVDQIISRLTDLNLLNDEDFIRRTIDDAVNFRFHGQLKVIQRLRLKGIHEKQVKKIWDTMKISEKEVAIKALKKAKKRFDKTPKEKLYQKRAQFLAIRGFPPSVVFELAKTPYSVVK